MIFSKKALGIEICPDGARMAVISGKPDMPRLDAYAAISFPPDTLQFSLREENIKSPAAFVGKIRESYLKLLTDVTRVSVSLPDAIGRVVLLDLETRFRTREEGADMIRWKLKKSFPFDVNELHLDYQVVQERESGDVSVLVSFISRRVINQYEDMFTEAGLQANSIDFTTFNICRLFSSRLEVAENAALMVWHQGVISILVFNNGLLDFFRSKDLSGSNGSNRIFREITSSLQIYKDKQPGHAMNDVFCIVPHDEVAVFRAVAAEATALEPIVLDVGRVVLSGIGSGVDKTMLHAAVAAMGAAVRNLR